MKATAIAPSNIAFIKYWGLKDDLLRLPTNGSISMNLNNLLTTTTVEFNSSLKNDEVLINRQEFYYPPCHSERSEESRSFGLQPQDDKNAVGPAKRVIAHLDRIRSLAKISLFAKVVSVNNFPSGTGLSSSASGFAALTLAAASAAGLELPEKELSILARLGSGSACRSIPDGFVEWRKGDTSESSYAVSLYPPDYWDIVDIVAIISKEKKEVNTSNGHKLAATSPFFHTRLERIGEKMRLLKQYLQEKDFSSLGSLIEAEALELHAIMLTSNPSLLYLRPETVVMMRQIRKWRQDGLLVYFTLNTGQDVHLICQKKDLKKVQQLLSQIPEVKKIIPNNPCKGACLIKPIPVQDLTKEL